MNRALSRALAFAMLLCFAGATAADTLSEALAAKRRGDYKAAYPLFAELAEKGDDKAAIEVGLMHHLGLGMPQDYGKAMDWYLKVFRKNGDAVNNIGVMYRDGLGVRPNRRIAYLLFLTVHMTGMGGQATVSRANGNLRREIAQLAQPEKEAALCYTMQYLVAYVEARGALADVPPELRASPERKRIKELNWWAPAEIGQFDCPADT